MAVIHAPGGRLARIVNRRPVLAVTTAAVIDLAVGGLYAVTVCGWLVRVIVAAVALTFSVDCWWLADQWRAEWRRETWRRMLARKE
jgi:hypothetical protein